MKYKTDNLGGITAPDGRKLYSHHEKNEEIKKLYEEVLEGEACVDVLSIEIQGLKGEPDIYDAVSQFRLQKEKEELKKKLGILAEAFAKISA